MNTAEIADDLNDDDLLRITGVDPRKSAIAKRKVMRVLDDAGIYYWLKFDGSICTTWAHVHNARKPEVNDETIPNWSAIK